MLSNPSNPSSTLSLSLSPDGWQYRLAWLRAADRWQLTVVPPAHLGRRPRRRLFEEVRDAIDHIRLQEELANGYH